MAVCDADLKFTYVNVGAYGSESDGGIFKNSELGKMLENQQVPLPDPEPIYGSTFPIPYYFVGDAAFGLRTYMMTPYCGRNLSPEQIFHNKELSRGRCTIENAFGVLAARWQIFLRSIICLPENVDNIVVSTVLLHNFVMTFRPTNQYNPNNFMDQISTRGEVTAGEWRNLTQNNSNLRPLPSSARIGARNATHLATNLRETIKSLVYNNSNNII